MSNANRIHLLSLSAGTLAHIANEYHSEEAGKALKLVLADIASLTEASVVKAAKAEPQPEAPVQEEAGSQPTAKAEPACGCGDATCALIDTLLGRQGARELRPLIDALVAQLGKKATATAVLEAIQFIQGLIAAGEHQSTVEDVVRLAELGKIGVELFPHAEAQPQVEIKHFDSLEDLLNGLFGKDKGETRH